MVVNVHMRIKDKTITHSCVVSSNTVSIICKEKKVVCMTQTYSNKDGGQG